MNKNNKRKSAVAAMALTLLIGAGSLAYFTDQKFGGMNAETGNVSLVDMGNITDDGFFVPGDNLSLKPIKSVKYTGNVNARYRVRIKTDGMEKSGFAYSTDIDTPGYHLIDSAGKAVELGEESPVGHLIDSGTITYVPGKEHSIELGGAEGYKLHINEATGNDFQDKPFSITFAVQALQEGQTNEDWTTLSNKTIEIVNK